MSFVQSLQNNPALFIAVVALMSLMIGSFLNAVIHRMPKIIERQWRAEVAEASGQPLPDETAYNLMVPRSACPSCNRQITALQNIPVVSYLLLRGRCASCGIRISPRYPIIETLTAALSGYVAWRFGFTGQTLAALIFVWAMIALAFIDLDTFYLPDDITLPLIWAGLLCNIPGTFTDLPSAVIGAAAGYAILWGVFWLFKLVTGKEGMGYGDFKLFAALGAWFGWQALVPIILLASVTGAVVGLAMKLGGKLREGGYLPFGPFLAASGLSALIFGPQAILRLIGLPIA